MCSGLTPNYSSINNVLTIHHNRKSLLHYELSFGGRKYELQSNRQRQPEVPRGRKTNIVDWGLVILLRLSKCKTVIIHEIYTLQLFTKVRDRVNKRYREYKCRLELILMSS